MKRLILVLALAAAAPCWIASAQEAEHKEGQSQEAGDEGGLVVWKWANFLVLAGGLGYLIKKNAGPFFAARSESIRKDLDESLRQKQEAEARVAEVDRRLANIEVQIAAMRADSVRETADEAARLSQQTAAEIVRIQARAEQEIASAGKFARIELKRYAAALAIRLAEQKLRARITPGAQDALVAGFARELR